MMNHFSIDFSGNLLLNSKLYTGWYNSVLGSQRPQGDNKSNYYVNGKIIVVININGKYRFLTSSIEDVSSCEEVERIIKLLVFT